MKVILDTNVLISGIFFSGPPYDILKYWADGKFQLILSTEILQEYQRVGETLKKQYTEVDLQPILELLTIKAHLVDTPSLPEAVCVDSDDDKFFACAIASNTQLIISGDKHLLNESGYCGIKVLKPRLFVEQYLKS